MMSGEVDLCGARMALLGEVDLCGARPLLEAGTKVDGLYEEVLEPDIDGGGGGALGLEWP